MYKKCPRCAGDMIQEIDTGKFSGKRKDGVYDETETKKYMCIKCGYIEEYAINPKFVYNTEH